MVNYEMSETKYKPREKSKPFRFFFRSGRKRYKASEIAVLEWQADIEKERFLNAEAILRAERRIGA